MRGGTATYTWGKKPFEVSKPQIKIDIQRNLAIGAVPLSRISFGEYHTKAP